MTETQTAKPPSSLTSSSAPLPPSSLSEADLAKRINETIESMALAFKSSVRRALEVGELLKEAKDRVKHGSFEAWLSTHCNLSFRTARRYMYFADHRAEIEAALNNGSITLDGKSVSVTDLSLSAAKRLIEGAPPSPPAGSTTLNGEEQTSEQTSATNHREPSQKQKLKRVEDFKKTWEEFEDWQRRKFLKSFKERIGELLDELESEVEAA